MLMILIKLKLNPGETDWIFYQKIYLETFDIQLRKFLTNADFSFAEHVYNICKNCFTVVSSHLDYWITVVPFSEICVISSNIINNV